MAAIFPNGTLFAVSTAFATPVAITDISNAKPGVADTTTPPTDGDILVITSGWTNLNERVVRADGATVDAFGLEGIDTTNTALYPVGEGAGSYKKASAWVTLSQATDISKSGGEQQFFQWQYIEDRSGRQRQRPTFKNAKSIALTLDYDPALAWYDALIEADAIKDPVVLRATLPNGAQLLYYVYPSFDGDPSMTLNQNMQNVATFSMTSEFTRYAS